MEVNGLNGPPPFARLRWKDFLDNHKFKIAIDFNSLIDVWGNQLFIFVILNIDTRKMVFINATYELHQEWLTQQFRNAFYDLLDYPSLCICDHDAIFSKWFSIMMKTYFGTRVLSIPIGTPEVNGKIERLNLSLKTEAFKNIVPINLLQTQKICSTYQKYYNIGRPHQGIDWTILDQFKEFPEEKKNYFEKPCLGTKFTTVEPMEMVAA